MTPEQYEKVRRLFHTALDLAGEEREKFLGEACAGDPLLRKEVADLLARDDARRELSARAEARVEPDNLISSSNSHTQEIGPYRILDVLGEGTMGRVFLAEQRQPIDRRVALKLIKHGMDTRETIARFDAEQNALALLNHANIATVHEAGETGDGRPYFVMEYVEGVPITEYCDRHKLGLVARLELFDQVCQGIQHAHQRGIIHRDIKPSNILVARADGKPIAKVIDFGVAKATNQRLTEKTLYTEFGRIIGTPAYMSPEQALMTPEGVDHRTDVYSLGVLLYEILAGELPLDWESFSKASFAEIVRRITDEEPPTPSVRWVRLSPARTETLAALRDSDSTRMLTELRGDLEWITMKSLEKDRERRYPSVSRLQDEIRRHIEGEPVEAGPPGLVYRIEKFSRKHRPYVMAAAGILICLTIALVASILFALEARIRAADNEVLADLTRVSAYREEMEDLWPDPGKPRSVWIDGVRSWKEKATELSSRLPRHEAELARVESEISSLRATGDTPSPARIQKRKVLEKLVGELRNFKNPRTGAIAVIERRVRSYPKTEEIEEAWEVAIQSIMDPEECPWYANVFDKDDPRLRRLRTTPHLYPIGYHPDRKLWEFVHLRTGGVPETGEDGELECTAESGVVLVLLPGGSFFRGAQQGEGQNHDPEANEDEKPVHEIRLSPFLMGKYEVTQEIWERVMGCNPSRFSEGICLPVEMVSWYDCEEFLDKTGLDFPSEAQWEYACRGREEAETPYSFGDFITTEQANWNGNHPCKGQAPGIFRGETVPVDFFEPNDFGLCQMHGNVWEWCKDFHTLYPANPRIDDLLDPVALEVTGGVNPDGLERVNRGGSWNAKARTCRSSHRDGDHPFDRTVRTGFRPCLMLR